MRLPIDVALELGMLVLERRNQRCHREEIIAADVEHELRIGEIAVEIGEIVDLRNRELEAAIGGVVVFAVLPGRKDVALGTGCAAKVGEPGLASKRRPPQERCGRSLAHGDPHVA